MPPVAPTRWHRVAYVIPLAGGKKVFIDGIDVVEVQATQAETNTALSAANNATNAALTETNAALTAATAANAALTTTLNTVLQRVTALEANQALVNDTALEARLTDLEVDASLPSLPPTPANWSLALFFEGGAGERSDAVVAKDSSAGAVVAAEVNGGNYHIVTHADNALQLSGGLLSSRFSYAYASMHASRNNLLDPSDARTISTSCLQVNSGTIYYAASPRWNMRTDDFAIEGDFYWHITSGPHKVGGAGPLDTPPAFDLVPHALARLLCTSTHLLPAHMYFQPPTNPLLHAGNVLDRALFSHRTH